MNSKKTGDPEIKWHTRYVSDRELQECSCTINEWLKGIGKSSDAFLKVYVSSLYFPDRAYVFLIQVLFFILLF